MWMPVSAVSVASPFLSHVHGEERLSDIFWPSEARSRSCLGSSSPRNYSRSRLRKNPLLYQITRALQTHGSSAQALPAVDGVLLITFRSKGGGQVFALKQETKAKEDLLEGAEKMGKLTILTGSLLSGMNELRFFLDVK